MQGCLFSAERLVYFLAESLGNFHFFLPHQFSCLRLIYLNRYPSPSVSGPLSSFHLSSPLQLCPEERRSRLANKCNLPRRHSKRERDKKSSVNDLL